MTTKNNTEFLEAQKSFGLTLNEISQSIPHECANELQYMLNHMMKSLDNSLPPKERDECIGKAVGHLRRAHLDYLKIAIFTLYRLILTDNPKRFNDFMKKLLKARLLEFAHIGTFQYRAGGPAPGTCLSAAGTGLPEPD